MRATSTHTACGGGLAGRLDRDLRFGHSGGARFERGTAALRAGALGKYLPKSIADEIIDKPELLALHGAKKDISCCSAISRVHADEPRASSLKIVAKLLNRYLETLSQVVLDHGGVSTSCAATRWWRSGGRQSRWRTDGTRAAKAAMLCAGR